MKSGYTVFKGAKLIDGTGQDPIESSELVIHNDLIESIGPAGTKSYPQDAGIHDLTGMTIMPGLIDAHCHLAGLKTMAPADLILDDPMLRGMRAVFDAWKAIDAGFTTVRDLGGVNALHLKEAVQEGSIIGPKIIAAGLSITQTGGHSEVSHTLPAAWNNRFQLSRVADGVAEVRKAAREQIRSGADCLKIMTTGGVYSERDLPTSSQFSREEIRACVEEAQSAGLKTAAHAQGTQGIKNALLCGIDSIEHGFYMDDECIELMLKQSTFLIPTFAAIEILMDRGAEVGISPFSLEKANVAREAHLISFQKAYGAGVKCGLGSDFLSDPLTPMGENAMELELYVKKAGLTPMEAIVCATKNNAGVCGLADKTGTLEPGKWADLIVLKDDPLKDIRVLRNKQNIIGIYRQGVKVPRLGTISVRGMKPERL